MGLAEGTGYLHRRYANHVPLSPLSFLDRAADVHPERLAVRYGVRSYDFAALRQRSRRLAGALQRLGVGRGDVVAMLAANTPEIFEAHFGVPLAGGILNTINTRLDADTIAYILDHGGARVFLTDTHLAREVRPQLICYCFCDVALDRKDVGQFAIKRIGPKMGIISRFD